MGTDDPAERAHANGENQCKVPSIIITTTLPYVSCLTAFASKQFPLQKSISKLNLPVSLLQDDQQQHQPRSRTNIVMKVMKLMKLVNSHLQFIRQVSA